MSRSHGGPPQLPAVGRNLYNQGTATGANSANGVTYPDTIKCYVCKRDKGHDAYSKRQLLNWRNTIYQPWAPGGRVRGDPRTTCKLCTQAQTTELTCCVCGQTKGLDEFSKVQRKAPDRARCKNCIGHHANVDPDLEYPDSDDCISHSNDDDGYDFDKPNGAPAAPTNKNPNSYNQKTSLGNNNNNKLTLENLKIKDEAEEWESVPSKPAAPRAPSYSGAASSRNAPSNANTNHRDGFKKENKAGWAKVQKIRQNYNDEDDDDDAEGEWADTKPRNKKRNANADPWDSIYS